MKTLAALTLACFLVGCAHNEGTSKLPPPSPQLMTALDAGAEPQPHPEFEGRRVKAKSGATVYLVMGGVRRGIPAVAYDNLFNSNPITDINRYDVLEDDRYLKIKEGSPLDADACLAGVKGEPTIYLVSNKKKRGITGAGFKLFDFSWKNIVKYSPESGSVLRNIPDGVNIDTTNREEDN